jgi:hypothetical protein
MKPHSTGSTGWISKDWRWSRGQSHHDRLRFSRSLGYPWFFWGEMIPSHGRTIQVDVKYSNLPRFFWGIPIAGPTLQVTDMLWQLWFTTVSVWLGHTGSTYLQRAVDPRCHKVQWNEGRTKVVEKNEQLMVPRKYPQSPLEKAITWMLNICFTHLKS